MNEQMTLSMLSYQLNKRILVKRSAKTVPREIRMWKILDDPPWRKDCLYLTDEKTFLRRKEELEDTFVLCSLWQKEEIPEKTAGFLAAGSESVPKLINLLQDIFQEFEDWKKEAREILAETGNVSRFLDLCSRYLQMDFFLADDDYAVLGASRDCFLNSEKEKIKKPSFLELDMINDLLSEEEYKNVKEKQEPFFYPATPRKVSSEEASLCFNLKVDGVYFGRLVSKKTRPLDNEGGLEFLGLMGKYLEDFYDDQKTAGNIGRQEFYRGMEQLLDGNEFHPEVTERYLAYKNWKREERYRVIKIRFMREVSLKYYCAQMETLFPECSVVEKEGVLYCIQNVSRKTDGEEEKFPLFLRESLCKAGISNEGALQELYWCRQEADMILEMGEKIQPQFWYYRFEDYMMEYIREHVSGKLPVSRVLAPEMEILKRYDEKNGGELLETLVCYLENQGNSTHTAQALYIHRTTLVHRMQKIIQLTGIDFSDFRKRLHLMLSAFLIMEEK